MPNIQVSIDNNEKDIKSILEIFWDDISFSLYEIDYFLQDDNIIWYKVVVDNKLSGYYYFDILTEDTAHIHVCLLPEVRQHKDQIGNKLKEVMKSTFPSNIEYLIALIPKSLPHVIVYALENNWMYLGHELSNIGKIFHMGIELDVFLEDIK